MPTEASPVRSLGSARCASSGALTRAKAPLRINFVGGGTDFPHFYEKHDGAALSSTINRNARVTVYLRDDAEVAIRSLDLDISLRYTLRDVPIYDGVLDLARAAIHRIGIRQDMDLDIHLEAPKGSGLGASFALTAAVLGAVASMYGEIYSLYEPAELNCDIERVELRIAGGKQGQHAATFGGFNLLEFRKDRVVETPLRADLSVLNDLEAHLLLCRTGKEYTNPGSVDKLKYFEEGREDTLRGMERLCEMAFEMKEALLTGALDRFGEILYEVYTNKKTMNSHLADGTPADAVDESARKHGVVGGKLVGAGSGGYLLLYCETRRKLEARQALEAMGGQFADFSFDGLGVQVWRSHSR